MIRVLKHILTLRLLIFLIVVSKYWHPPQNFQITYVLANTGLLRVLLLIRCMYLESWGKK